MVSDSVLFGRPGEEESAFKLPSFENETKSERRDLYVPLGRAGKLCVFCRSVVPSM